MSLSVRLSVLTSTRIVQRPFGRPLRTIAAVRRRVTVSGLRPWTRMTARATRSPRGTRTLMEKARRETQARVEGSAMTFAAS